MSGNSSATIKWQELLDAFLFVNAAPIGENSACLSLITGQIRLHSSWTDIWENAEDEDSREPEGDDGILHIPHKTELGLGRDLALWFVEEIIPDSYEEVEHFFQKRGAYAKFKALLTGQGLLQEWYEFEKQAEEQALRNWCTENAVRIIEDGTIGADTNVRD